MVVVTLLSLAKSFMGCGMSMALFGQALVIAGFLTNIDSRWARSASSHEVDMTWDHRHKAVG